MSKYEKECPYCGSRLAGRSVSLKEDGSIIEVKSELYWCTSEDCLGKPGVARTFNLDNDGFLVECGVEDIELIELSDFYDDDDEDYEEEDFDDY